MPVITLPDGSTRSYDEPVAARKVAADIGPGLAKSSVGCRINGALRDLATVVAEDSEVRFVLERPKGGAPDADALFLLRHTSAHVMAEAIQQIWPQAELVYGPPTGDGFFYDIRFPEGTNVSSKDFEEIEKRMAAIVAADRPMTRYEMGEQEALEKLRKEGNKYKVDNAVRALEGSPDKKPPISFYATGEPGKNWEDLCMGPHIPSTGRIKAFKILSLAASYWHGDENSDRLTRVYGTAFYDKTELANYLQQLEEARERDHRVIGKRLRLFVLDEMVGQGLVLWTPAGAVIRQELQTFISEELRKQGYLQVFTPHIGKLELYRTSGHFPYYADSQYPPFVERETLAKLAEEKASCGDLLNHLTAGDIEGYLLKPMNSRTTSGFLRARGTRTATCRSAWRSSGRSTAGSSPAS